MAEFVVTQRAVKNFKGRSKVLLRETAEMAKGERGLNRASAMTNSIKEVSRNVATMQSMAGQNRMRQLTRGGSASASASASAGATLPSDSMRRIAIQQNFSTKNAVPDTDTARATDTDTDGAGAWKWN